MVEPRSAAPFKPIRSFGAQLPTWRLVQVELWAERNHPTGDVHVDRFKHLYRIEPLLIDPAVRQPRVVAHMLTIASVTGG
jgi:hypothetical protein